MSTAVAPAKSKSARLSSVSIRRARLSDDEWLLGELKKFSKFADTKTSLFGDDESARRGVHRLIAGHLVLIAERAIPGGTPSTGVKFERVGFVAGIRTPHFFNPAVIMLAELFWWVAEEHRRSRVGGQAAIMLLDEFVAQAKDLGGTWITFCLEHNSPVNEKALLKRGFRLQEHSYLLEP